MKMKRLISVMLIAAMAVTLAACGSGGGESSSNSANVAGGGDGTSGVLTIWEGTSERLAVAEYYEKVLEEMYPDLDVQVEAKPENELQTALQSAFDSGSGPDVYYTLGTKNSVFGNQVEAGNALELTDVDMSLFDDENGEPSMIAQICYWNDKLYAVPTSSIDTRTVYYNTDIFEENGYKIPTTIDEFEAICDDMLSKGVTPLVLAATDWASIMHAWDFLVCTQDGGPDFFNRLGEGKARFNEDVNVKAFEMMMDWKDKGYFSVSSSADDANAACMEFATGSTGMIICGSWLLNTIRSANEELNFDVFKIPNEADGKVYACITANGGYSVNPNAKNMEAAMMFINWMATADGQQAYIDSNNSIPALPETPSKDSVSTKIGAADTLIASNEEKIFLFGDGCEAVFQERIMDVFNGVITAKEFCDLVEAEQD